MVRVGDVVTGDEVGVRVVDMVVVVYFFKERRLFWRVSRVRPSKYPTTEGKSLVEPCSRGRSHDVDIFWRVPNTKNPLFSRYGANASCVKVPR
jgi:hypothetical protein